MFLRVPSGISFFWSETKTVRPSVCLNNLCDPRVFLCITKPSAVSLCMISLAFIVMKIHTAMRIFNYFYQHVTRAGERSFAM